MKFNTAPFRNWFGFTRRERRSSYMLLLLILFIFSVRFIFPEKNLSVENVPLDFNYSLNDLLASDSSNIQGAEEKSPGRSGWSQKGEKKKKLIIDINRCDTSELIKLNGIGTVLSVRIIKYRQLLGGFARNDQLSEVYGLPAETYDRIKDQIFVDTLMISTINVNSADYKTLIRFPYFEKYEVSSILKFRELEGRIRDIFVLVDNKLITVEKAKKVRPYLRFE
jgi:DNA uptake protein ComE-like DNA-binding protein